MSTQSSQKLKRGRGVSGDHTAAESKKPRRSQRLSEAQQLPSPVTGQESIPSDVSVQDKDQVPTPKVSDIRQRTPEISRSSLPAMSSPPQDTQATEALSQFILPHQQISDEVEDEAAEGVWGYLIPLSGYSGKTLVLKKRNACPMPDAVKSLGDEKDKHDTVGKNYEKEEEAYEETKKKGIASGGYLIGRHPECDVIMEDPIISNRHCLLFTENKAGNPIAVIEDLSSNGTFVNDAIIGRNKRRELQDQDEITLLDRARFIFRSPKLTGESGFKQQYTLLEKLGKGHFAEVYLCVEKATGERFAVKVFTKRPGDHASKTDGLQQEIAVLMGISHPNLLCLKDTFDEEHAVYLILELAAEGELFNWIVMKQKLTESETRKVFTQLFQATKYLHDRNIVHRDIKPENILLTDKDLHVKVADFGLAKIIGEESFTSTLCGTPSYVAPEILENSDHRRYTRAVDVWSLGVVLYICLCGFPPFSDELYSKENPYTLGQQIRMGRFDYPSPYWDSVGDPALDLIDRMLTVDVEKRYTIDQCLEHCWTTQSTPNPNDSTDGLVGGLESLDFTKKRITRERTLLSHLNTVTVARIIGADDQKDPVKVFNKNAHMRPPQKDSAKKGTLNGVNGKTKAAGLPKSAAGAKKQEATPAAQRNSEEFLELGGKGDQPLFGYDGGSVYSKKDLK